MRELVGLLSIDDAITRHVVLINLLNSSEVNDCLRNNGGCHKNAACFYHKDELTCRCWIGYSGNGYDCNGEYADFNMSS